jgi:hypothetical protein
MLIDLWHHYLLLRPLLVFVLAAPLLIGAVLFRGPGRPRSAERKTDDAPETAGAVTGGDPDPGREPGVEASPHEWRVSASQSGRRAA